MARPRNNFVSMVNDDGEVSLDELLMQIEQLQPVNQQAETTYQAEPVFVPSQESVYQPVIQQQVQQTYDAPQNIQQVIDQIATQLSPSLINQIVSQQQNELPNQQVTQEVTQEATQEETQVQDLQPAKPTQPAKPSDSVVNSLTRQILGSSDNSKWQGGVDAETAARDMANIMAGIGITDISQFGKITQTGLQEDVRSDGRGGYVDQRGNPVDPNIVQTGSYETEGGRIDYATAPVGTQVTYGNKETNQAVPNTYSERQTGNAFGGTFEGKGNTGYRVDFDASGKPVFYTTGASSRDDIGVFAPIIAAALTPILGPAAASLLGPTASTLATNALTGALVGGGTSAITGDSILQGALLGGAGGALTDIISPYLPSAPTAEVPIDFVGGTTEQINDALQSQLVNDLKAAGVTNVSEFVTNTGGNASSFVPSDITPVVQAPIETIQVASPLAPASTIDEVVNAIVNQQTLPEVQVTAEQPVAPTVQPTIEPTVMPTVEQIIQAITEPVAPTIEQAVQQAVEPIQNVEVTAPIQTTTPTINEVINAITQTAVTEPTVVEQTPQTIAPTETVQITEPVQAVAPTTNEIVSAIIQSGITEPSIIQEIINAVTTPEVQITESVQPTAPTINEIINAIVQPAIAEPTINQPVENVAAPTEEVTITQPAQTEAERLNEILDVISQIQVDQLPVEQVTTPVEIVEPKAKEQIIPDVINVINPEVATDVVVPQTPTLEVTTPRVETPTTVDQVIAAIVPELIVTSQTPQEPEQPIPTIIAPPIQETVPQITTIAERPSTITNEAEPTPVIVAPPITGTTPPKTYTTAEIIDMIRLGVLGASVLGATTQETGPTGFPIVPVPAEWRSPVYAKDLPSVAPTQLPPIDFGNRNLLIGTQWEKFLDPNYGKVPAPIQFNQPSDMSYDRLMSILGTSRDVLPSQTLSINDVISGIQNQYG